MGYEVDQPILNSPYEEPREHWLISQGETPRRMSGRRRAMYFYRPPEAEAEPGGGSQSMAVELELVNFIRERLTSWRKQDYPGVSRTTLELLRYWQRDGRQHRLFFAQLEAAETIIFLTEARQDFLHGIEISRDEPGDDGKQKGHTAFLRYACKMATGSGKTTVMAMLAAWSILNKVNARSDGRFSDTVLVVCPNVTIRNRLQELLPERGEASLYRTRDIVPAHLMPELLRGTVVVTNWHVFEPQSVLAGGVSARVVKAGVPVRRQESIFIGEKATTSRGRRYLTRAELERLVSRGFLEVKREEADARGELKKVVVDATRYVESDASVVNRVLGRQVGGKKNILVFNDEAHHAYRIRKAEPEEGEESLFGEEEADEEFFQEATVWVEGLDRIHKLRGINFCVDLSATPYYLGRVGQQTNRTFPWVVSDFGLTDSIESGLVKIPQLVVRDTTGQEIPGYFNIWRHIMEKLTAGERGGKKGSPKPEAILKWAANPVALLAANWDELRKDWDKRKDDPRPPVFIIVCKNTRIARAIYEWIAENKLPAGISPWRLEAFTNTPERVNTIRVDSKVVHETDSAEAKSDESAWMRLTLDTVGKVKWPEDRQARPLYPEGFEELAKKLGRPLHPPGRDVRCIVSVGMLTEGWDCSTVTHIIGLRPFMSQLLCEQVVGRGLRRTSYAVGENDLLSEEVSKVFGVPFEIVPFKASPDGKPQPPVKRYHVHALPSRAELEIRFPRVQGYRQAIRSRLVIDWDHLAPVTVDPQKVPPEVQVKASLPSNSGRPSLLGPGRIENITMNPFRQGRRLQELAFELAADLTRQYARDNEDSVPVHVMFPQIAAFALRYLQEKVVPVPPADRLDVFLSPYYGWVIERLKECIHGDAGASAPSELPLYEARRPAGSTAGVDFWTSREVREVIKSHVNYVAADTKVWEEAAAYALDTHPRVEAFVKNAGLGFAIPYLHNGEPHEYLPDFIVRLAGEPPVHLILETKGFDELADVKAQAADRWVKAVNAEGTFGAWRYAVVRKVEDVRKVLSEG